MLSTSNDYPIDKYLLSSSAIYGNLIVVNNKGILLLAPSRVGKSHLSLALLNHGAMLVSDDVTYIKTLNDSRLIGYANPKFLGIIMLDKVIHLAENQYLNQHTIDMIIIHDNHNFITNNYSYINHIKLKTHFLNLQKSNIVEKILDL